MYKLFGLIIGLFAFQHSTFSQSAPEGEYSVGFNYEWVTNFGRNECGEIGESNPGKQVLLGIWYPAIQGTQKAMKIGDYVHMTGLKGNDMLVKKMDGFAEKSWVSYTMTDYEDSSYTSKIAAFNKSLEFECKSKFEATPIDDKFPVVIYHHGAGGTYDDNLMMCEYLASHGYVVISSSFLHCQRNTVFEDSDWTENVSDLQAVLTHIHTMDNADANQTALMGHSRGCQIGYAAVLGRSSPYKCFIALDPTWDGQSYEELYNDWGKYNMLSYIHSNRSKMITPILHIASFRRNSGIPDDSAKVMNAAYQMQFPITDLFVHSDRTMVTTHSDHFHEAFISQGAHDCIRMKPNLTDPEDIDEITLQIDLYPIVCETILSYLDDKLKPSNKNELALTAFLDTSITNENIFNIRVEPSKPIPTLEDEWPGIVERDGLKGITSILKREKEESGYHEFSHEYMVQEFFHKNRDLSKQIIEHYATMYPDSWKVPFLKGLFAFNSGQREDAEKFYEEALKLSPPDHMVNFLENNSYYVWQ